jgi:dihydroneopterin aldolase
MLRNIAHEVLAESPKNLLETLADEMADKVLDFSKVELTTVTLEKHGIFPDCIPGVSVTKKREGLGLRN